MFAVYPFRKFSMSGFVVSGMFVLLLMMQVACSGPQDNPNSGDAGSTAEKTTAVVDGGSQGDSTQPPESTVQPEASNPPESTTQPETATQPEKAPGKSLSFATNVLPILQKATCSNGYCHGSGRGGLKLTGTAADLQQFVGVSSKSGAWKRVVPGDPAKSLLYEKLSKETPAEGDRMPPRGKLTAEDIQVVHDWIKGGAKP